MVKRKDLSAKIQEASQLENVMKPIEEEPPKPSQQDELLAELRAMREQLAKQNEEIAGLKAEKKASKQTERKTRRAAILLRPSVYDTAQEYAQKQKISFNELCERALLLLTTGKETSD